MPSIEGRHDGRQVFLQVAVLRADIPTDLTSITVTALLDTGATTSGIGPAVIEQLGLLSHEKRPLASATEFRLVDYYLFRLGLFTSGNAGDIPYVFGDSAGFGWREPRSFDVILGMDILRQCDLRIDRSSAWSLSFG